MTVSRFFVTGFFRLLTSLLCRIDDKALRAVPPAGPLILVSNHTHLIEIPIIYTRLQPRRVHGYIASHRWQNPLLAWLLDTCETIPLQRGEADISAIRRGLQLLQQKRTLIIMPEGTRNYTGVLQAAHPGVVTLALHSGALIQAIATTGSENFSQHLKNLHRCPFTFAVGPVFHLKNNGEKVTSQVRQAMLMEIMAQIAVLLPESQRGVYAQSVHQTPRYVEFLE
ncbi:MAG: lysophospholipid acyltransferase family protein [Anaerolineales bacterium]